MNLVVQIFILASIPILAFLLVLVVFFLAYFYNLTHNKDKE